MGRPEERHHAADDAVIRMFTGIVHKPVRDADTVGRWCPLTGADVAYSFTVSATVGACGRSARESGERK